MSNKSMHNLISNYMAYLFAYLENKLSQSKIKSKYARFVRIRLDYKISKGMLNFARKNLT